MTFTKSNPSLKTERNDMNQEVWITLRFKGYVDANADLEKVAAELLENLQSYIELGVSSHGFMTSQPGDVIEIEDEAAIYSSDAPS